MLSSRISSSLRPFLNFLVRTKTFSTHDKPKNSHDVRRKRFNTHATPEHPPDTKNPPRTIAGTGNSPYLRMLSATSA